MKKILFLCKLFAAIAPASFSQTPSMSASEIQLRLKKLNVLGSVLYVAAHPDDENTRLIAYLANERMARTAYLSITRGDGGQNLIGTEKGPLMGLLRTQELIEARKKDGGEQLFTRADDFGYSKSFEETLKIWGKDKVLADVVWAIRKFQPDVIITRFPEDNNGGHGHHVASAMLAHEAFDAVADSNMFSGQLQYVRPWQPKRLLLNASTWWNKDLPELAKQSDEYLLVDVGTYNPLLGKSYSEIAAESRSMHKSQGFGASKDRGSKPEYLQHKLGEKAKNDLFDGVDLSWKKLNGGEKVSGYITEAIEKFNPENPSKILPQLVNAYKALDKIPDCYWKKIKKADLKEVILSCAGLWLEATAENYSGTPGSSVKITASVVNRCDHKFRLKQISYPGGDTLVAAELAYNDMMQIKQTAVIPADAVYSHPYWLENENFSGIYDVKDQQSVGKPENDHALNVDFLLEADGIELSVRRPLVYKWTDRVDGELYRSFAIVPEVTANIEDKVFIFPDNNPRNIVVVLKSNTAPVSGKVNIELPDGWKAAPASIAFDIKSNGAEKNIIFTINPPGNYHSGELTVKIECCGKSISKSFVSIEYSHIRPQLLFPEAKAKLVRLDIAKKGNNVGYITGPGDEVPQAIKQLGYKITIIEPDVDTKEVNLETFDAIIAGIRIYNTEEKMIHFNKKLLDYVKNGGTYIVQYNTRDLQTEELGPYPFQISRYRVTEEDAPVTFLDPEHPMLVTPNKITKADFDGWVQERGLYFADEWSHEYTPLLSWNDHGEEPQNGSLIVAKYGKGFFIYTGIAFFRQLPAGVPGAYRLMTNMISYGK